MCVLCTRRVCLDGFVPGWQQAQGEVKEASHSQGGSCLLLPALPEQSLCLLSLFWAKMDQHCLAEFVQNVTALSLG